MIYLLNKLSGDAVIGSRKGYKTGLVCRTFGTVLIGLKGQNRSLKIQAYLRRIRYKIREDHKVYKE